jgi:flagellar capping protein FliD
MKQIITDTLPYILPSLLALIGTIVVAVLAYKQGAAKDRKELKQSLTKHFDEKIQGIVDDLRQDATRYRGQLIELEKSYNVLLAENIEITKKFTLLLSENISIKGERETFKKEIDNLTNKIKSLEKRLSAYEKNIK